MTPPAEESDRSPRDDPAAVAGGAATSSKQRAWRQRPFAVFLSGSLLSWIGDWMDLTALNWAVLQLTNSPLDLGIINACRLGPVFILSIPAGVLADRRDQRQLLMLLQTGLMLLTFAVGLLFAARAEFWVFAAIVAIRSSLAAMVLPIRNAILPSLVDRSAQAEAIALQTAAMNLSRIAGPALAGLIIAGVSVESVFWINGTSFLAVLATTLYVQPQRSALASRRSTILSDVVEAAGYIRRNRSIQSLFLLAIVPMVFGFPYATLMPLFARDLYGLGPEGFGALLSISAAGALCGAIWLSFVGEHGEFRRRLIRSILIFGIGLLASTAATGFSIAAAALFVVGWASQSYRTLSRITLVAEVPYHLRGRILSIALLDRGFIPMGALFLGAIAEYAGTRAAGLVMGSACIILTLIVAALDRRNRRG